MREALLALLPVLSRTGEPGGFTFLYRVEVFFEVCLDGYWVAYCLLLRFDMDRLSPREHEVLFLELI